MIKVVTPFLIFSFSLILFSCTKENGAGLSKIQIDIVNAKSGGNTIPDIKTGLVAYFPFSGNANDASGNGNNGIVNNVILTTDRFGSKNKAYLFDGISSNIEISNKFFDNGWDNMTVSLWFNANSNTGIRGHTLVNTIPHDGFAFGYSYNNSNKIYVYKNASPEIPGWDILLQWNSINTISINTWNHFVIVKNGLNYSIYLNGILDNSFTAIKSPVVYSCGIRIGAISYLQEYFGGKMDEIRFYNRALTSEQIAYLATK